MSKPEWLPETYWASLRRYRSPRRLADPTVGFMLTCARCDPDWPERSWRALRKSQEDSFLKRRLGIPPVTVDTSKEEDNER